MTGRTTSRLLAPAMLWGALAAGCEPVVSEHAPPTTPPVIRVGYTGEADFGDLPSFLAHDRLRDRGFRIEPVHFSAADVAVGALSRGTVDVTHGSMISAWNAIGRGARVRTIMEHVGNPYRLVSVEGIAACANLDGRRLALPAESAVSTHLVRAFLDEECPDAKPEVFLLTESSNRAAAFLAGRVDAGGLELSSLLWLETQAPGRFRVMSDFSTRWPRIKTTGVHVNADFAAARPEIVGDYLRALLDANRDVKADPALLTEAAGARLGRSEDWSVAARTYLDARVWPDGGGLTREDVESTLAFFQTHSRLDDRLTPDSVVDLRFLQDALRDPAAR